VSVHVVARELNPDPETLATVPLLPIVGVTEIFGITPKLALAGMSFTGVPLTVTFQLMFTVA